MADAKKRKVSNKGQLITWLNNVCTVWDESFELEVSCKKWSPQRSLGQNSLFHVWMGDIAKTLSMRSQEDFDSDWVKTQLKRRFGLTGTRQGLFSGKDEPYLISTADYEDYQMSDLLMKVQVWAADIQITLDVKNCKMYMEYREASM